LFVMGFSLSILSQRHRQLPMPSQALALAAFTPDALTPACLSKRSEGKPIADGRLPTAACPERAQRVEGTADRRKPIADSRPSTVDR
jgi:hypothetical protein